MALAAIGLVASRGLCVCLEVVVVMGIHAVVACRLEKFGAIGAHQSSICSRYMACAALTGCCAAVVTFEAFAHQGQGVVSGRDLDVFEITMTGTARDLVVHVNLMVHLQPGSREHHARRFVEGFVGFVAGDPVGERWLVSVRVTRGACRGGIGISAFFHVVAVCAGLFAFQADWDEDV